MSVYDDAPEMFADRVTFLGNTTTKDNSGGRVDAEVALTGSVPASWQPATAALKEAEGSVPAEATVCVYVPAEFLAIDVPTNTRVRLDAQAGVTLGSPKYVSVIQCPRLVLASLDLRRADCRGRA